MLYLGLILVYTTALVCILQVLQHYRTAQSAIGWIIALLTLPYLALPLYLVFGRNRFEGYARARRKDDRKLDNLAFQLDQLIAPHRPLYQQPDSSKEVFETLARLPFTEHNRCTLLVNGNATIESMFNSILNAERYILTEFYIVRDDELGLQFKTLLMKKARSGVIVFFLYDDVGCAGLSSEYLRDLQEAGILVHPFGTLRSYLKRLQLNFRNHRKIVVTDGETGYVGGINIGDEYLDRTTRYAPWRDTHLKIEGPAVMGLQLSFLEDWHWATGYIPELPKPNLAPKYDEDQKALILATGPADELNYCELFFLQCINQAKSRLWIATPYFVPDIQIMSALQLASLRGVDVRILIPRKPDHKFIYYATYSYLAQADTAGIKIYRYEKGFMHQKVLLVDDTHGVVGTANLDNRSMKLNFEVSAIVHDKSFVAELTQVLVRDFSASNTLPASQYELRSLPFKLLCRAARLLAPIL
ncbi:cardiolipin synthetase [Oleiphilus messinensis]|uniref:Cardiolipin synthase n=1 Tax=Oleiphilus messinensis TaxID=141451 RepID=A0A1Y0I393_9GAMM|nr:cardiolipin synthase [Oleiphilus messinensis]ARU54942.1 cardiolipin synthetase [Oleiphilus messinensis]